MLSAVRTSLLVTLALGVSHPAMADRGAADFFAGKKIDFYISSTAGGAYDLTGRHIIRYLGRNIPGNPSVTPRNMPGGGGLSMANHLTNVAPKDGLAVGILLSSAVFEPLHGNAQAKFDVRSIEWLGSPTKDVAALTIWHTVPVDTLDQARHSGLTLAVSGGLNSTPAFYGRMLAFVFDLPIKLVGGYSGQNEAFLAMERGEVQGFPSVALSSIKSSRPNWLAEKKVKQLVYFGGAEHPELKHVPFAAHLLKDRPDRAKLMELAIAPLAIGRPVFAPPGIPGERASALRDALWKTFHDPGYLEECQKQNLECDGPTSGNELRGIILDAYSAPPDLVEIVKKINTVN